ncbi:MAG: Do family serine endopeptidase [Chitinispirillaceae bacterium]|jgi:serine protease Do
MKASFWFRPVLFTILGLLIFFPIGRSCLHAGPKQKKEVILGAATPPNIPNPGPMGTIFADIAAKTVPTVVSVIPSKIDTVLIYNNPFYNFFGDTSENNPFNFFFGFPHSGGGGPPVRKEQHREQALGAGVIISPEGLILSNYHVVKGASEIEVRLSDGRSFAATIVGSDSLADVAVIRIKEKVNNLPTAYLGNSDSLRPGDWVLAVGNPFAFISTVTVGVVSALNRQVESSTMYENFIQTDAAINPGNSGGALVNIKGELVGINTLIYTQTGGFMGIGFAVPINMARHDAEELITTGKVIRGWIGVSIQDITPAIQDAMGLPDRKGALISGVVKGDPADRAGLRAGDVIVSIDSQSVTDGNDLRNRVADIEPGSTVPISVIRQGKNLNLTITVVERTATRVAEGEHKPSAGENQELKTPRAFGMEIAGLTPDMRRKYAIAADVAGVVITKVNSSIGDDRMSLKAGDVIERVKINGGDFQDIRSVDQLKTIAGGVKNDTPVILLVARGNATFFVAFKTP